MGRELAARLIDLNPPRVLRDSDSGVRIKICEALGGLKAKTKSACETGLLRCMADDYEREAVRNAAYKALCAVFGLARDGRQRRQGQDVQGLRPQGRPRRRHPEVEGVPGRQGFKDEA